MNQKQDLGKVCPTLPPIILILEDLRLKGEKESQPPGHHFFGQPNSVNSLLLG